MTEARHPMDKSCSINLHNVHGWDFTAPGDRESVQKLFEQIALKYARECWHIDIYPQERVGIMEPSWRDPGKMMWVMRVVYHTREMKEAFTIAVLQRHAGHELEFHS